MSKPLEGKVGIVTGAGRGIGKATALKFAREGANVVVNDLDEDSCDEVVAEIEAMGRKGMAFPYSVTKPDFGTRLVQATLDRLGAIDIIVNNAGYTWDNVIQKMTDEQFEAIIDCHLKAPFRLLRAVQPYFRDMSKAEADQSKEVFRKVVNISSISGTQGNAGQINYASAKSGVMGLTKTLAKEWGRLRVNVNCVAYGAIATRLTERVPEKKTIMVDGHEVKVGIPVNPSAQPLSATIPFGRMGTVEEAAGAIYMFCIPESDYVTGQTIICGGGRGGF